MTFLHRCGRREEGAKGASRSRIRSRRTKTGCRLSRLLRQEIRRDRISKNSDNFAGKKTVKYRVQL